MKAALAFNFCVDSINESVSSVVFVDVQAWYFDRDDVALNGFHKFFKKQSEEEREHADKFMKYQNMRGGRVVLQNIQVGY